MDFYHGTMISDIKELKAFSKDHLTQKNTLVYVTPNRAYALFYIRDIEIDHVTCGINGQGIIRYDEQFPNQLMTLYKGMSGYIYKCNPCECLEKTSVNGVWASKMPILVEDTQYIADVYDEIMKYVQEGLIDVIRYETLDQEKKQRFYDMWVKYFYENDTAAFSDKKRQFYIDSFSDAWNYVKSSPEKKEIFLEKWSRKYSLVK